MAAQATLSRAELFDRIWNTPATKLAKELGVSVARLFKACAAHDIPRPTSGHWMRISLGQEIERPALPPAPDADHERVTIERSIPRNSEAEPPSVPVPDRLASPHPMVARALAMLQESKADSDGLVYSRGSRAVRISVSPKQVNRAARIMDAFVKAMVEKDFDLQPDQPHEHANVVLKSKSGRNYPLKLREHLHRTALPLTAAQKDDIKQWGYSFGDRYKYAPDGQLVLIFDEDYKSANCPDTANTRIEDKLGRFVARVVQRIADDEERMRQIAEERAAEQREREEHEKRAEEEARLRKEDENRIAELMDMLSRWRLSRDIRQWLKETKQLITLHDAKPTAGGPIDLWLQWVEAYANRIDPVAPSMDKLKEIRAMNSPSEPPG
jgi:hypothetical protein